MIYVFGDHELDEGLFQLRRAGRAVALQPKVLALLLYLVRHRDRVVAKQEILAALWPDAVVTGSSLARAVSLARAAIGDPGRAPRTIVTVARRGYRFQGSVVERGAPAAPEADLPVDDLGRAALLARLAERVDAALRGHGAVLLLAGEAGVGKSRTAAILAARAEQHPATAVCAASADPRSPSYTIWRHLLRALARARPGAYPSLPAEPRATLARLLPEAGPAPANRRGSREQERLRLFDAVRALLLAAAREGPVALFLDDLHAADVGSLALLEHVGQAIDGVPIAIVATVREGGEGQAPRQARALASVGRLPAVERWPLEGLSLEGVRAFARRWLGAEADPDLLAALARTTHGNPLLLAESLRSLEARGLLASRRAQEEWEALLPEGILHLLRPRIRALSAAALEVLAAVSAIGVEIDRGLLARALGSADPEPPLRELRAAGLLESAAPAAPHLRFRHRLVRDAVYEALLPPGDARRAWHARILAALDTDARAEEGTLAERAHHACEAAPLVDPGRGSALARAAGDQAGRLLDLERAASWYERALALLDASGARDCGARAELQLALAAARTPTVGHERALPTYREAADDARAAGRADLLAEAIGGRR